MKTVKIVNNKSTMDKYKHRGLSCSNCKQAYCVTVLFGKKAPLLLECGHNQCYGCIHDDLQVDNKIVCNVCSHEKTCETPLSAENLRAAFPLNLYIVGQLVEKSQKKPIDSMIAFKNRVSCDKKVAGTQRRCYECTDKLAEFDCKQCGLGYCTTCFDNVHKVARSLKMHERVPLKTGKSAVGVIHCTTHADQKVEFYCKTCTVSTCAHCAVVAHGSHVVVLKRTENESMLGELKEAFEEASKIHKRLQFTRKKAQYSSGMPDNKLNINLAQIETEITKHFQFLHGLLQVRELKVLEKLTDAKSETSSSLKEAMNELNTYIKDLEDVLDSAREALNPMNIAWVDASEVIERLKEVQNKPCYLVLESDKSNEEVEDVQEKKLRLTVDDSVFEAITNHCDLVVPGVKKFTLKSEKELPEDYVIDPLPEKKVDELLYAKGPLPPPAETQTVPKFGAPSLSSCTRGRSTASSVYSEGEAASEGGGSAKLLQQIELANISFVKAKSRSNQSSVGDAADPKGKLDDDEIKRVSGHPDLTPGTMENVIVSHLSNPTDFFIQRRGATAQLKILETQINKLHVQNRNQPKEVHQGALYLVQYESDKKWYRARVCNVIDEKNIVVFYIDFGNEESVSIKRLRHLPPTFSKFPELAVHCELFDCHPQPGPEWSKEAIKMMVSITKGDEVSMHVMKKKLHSCKLEVDLKKFSENSSLSIRDTLIFHEFASFAESEKLSTMENNLKKRTFFFLQKTELEVGTILDITVCHVESPANFYAQGLSGRSFYSDVQRRMNEFYSKKLGQDFTVFAPSVGMPVAVFDSDGNWHRGKITDLPGGRNVTICFVDTGKVKTMHWDHLKALEHKFLKMTIQCIECSLGDVKPLKSDGEWSVKSTKAFSKLVLNKHLKATVVGKEENKRVKLVLYESTPEMDICLNGLLVTQGFAESIGMMSSFVEFPKLAAKLKPPSSATFEQTVKKTSYVKKHLRKYLGEPQVSPAASMDSTLQQSQRTSSMSGEAEATTDDEDGMGSVRFAVNVISITSPGLFYISFLSQEAQIKKLKEEMLDFYSDGDIIETHSRKTGKWEEGDRCAVQRKKDVAWYRALVTKVLPENKVQLFLKDIAEVMTVDVSDVLELDETFMAIQDGAFKCHMCGISAAGGSGTWPSIAIEEFQEMIQNTTKVYFTQRGEVDDKDKSVPTELSIKSIVDLGPLEPTKHVWFTINDYLVNKGLALPVKSELKSPSESMKQFILEKSEKVPKDELSDESSAKSKVLKKKSTKRKEEPLQENRLTEWLPAEPLKRLKFTACPTYVDNDAAVYIQEPESAPVLTMLTTSLLSKYKDSKPMPHDLFWFCGQLCIAQYHADLKWYRGKVLKINDDNTLKVQMVDYGNIENCKASDLRKNILLTQIPIQCHRCTLPDLTPISENGKWTIQSLDYIHATVVETPCEVEVVGDAGNYAIKTLKPPGGLTMADLLLSMNYAKYSIDCDATLEDSEESDGSVIVEKEEEESTMAALAAPPKADQQPPSAATAAAAVKQEIGQGDSDPLNSMSWFEHVMEADKMKKLRSKQPQVSFHQIQLPESVSELLVDVTCILSPTSFQLQIYPVNEPEVASIKNVFIQMQDRMQIEAPHQPLLEHPLFEGQVCCSRFESDDKWYRGLITKVLEGDSCTVKYIDYGNVEDHPLSALHQVKDEWMYVPMQGLQCTLWGVKLAKGANLDKCFATLEQDIFVSPLHAKVKKRLPLRVELYKDDSTLAYQRLLDEKLFEVVEEPEE